MIKKMIFTLGFFTTLLFGASFEDAQKAQEKGDYKKALSIYCKNRSKPDNDARVRPDAKTEFNRTVKRCSTGH